MSSNKALNEYIKVNSQEAVSDASPHRLIQMLMDGALQRMAEGKGAMQRNATGDKGIALGKAISIVGGLSDSLNLEVEGGLPQKLAKLYEYMVHCLMTANINNDASLIDEAINTLKTIKSGWDEITPEFTR